MIEKDLGMFIKTILEPIIEISLFPLKHILGNYQHAFIVEKLGTYLQIAILESMEFLVGDING